MTPPTGGPFERMLASLEKGGEAGLRTAIERLAKAAEQARGPYAKLSAAMDDPATRAAAGRMVSVRQEADRLNATLRMRVELEARRQAVASGAYARDLRAQQVIRREQERIFEMERRARFGEQYGRFGGLAYQADRLSRTRAGQMIATAGAATGAVMGGMTRSGFSGTVEGNRLNLELEMISRELAGAFKPAIEAATWALGGLRKFLERLGPRGQDAVMAGGLALGMYGTYRFAGAAGRMLGFGGAAAGGAAAAGGGGGLAAAMSAGWGGGAAGAAGGAGAAAAAGSRWGMAARTGALAGVGALARDSGVGTEAVVGAGAVGAGLARRAGTGLLRGAARFAAPVAAGMAGYDAVDMYSARREAGESRLGAGARSLAHGLTSFATLGMVDLYDKPGERGGRPGREADGPNPARRSVTLADAGFEASGSAFERIANKLALVTADGETEAGGTTDWLSRIHDLVAGAVRGAGALPPPPMPGR